MVWIFKHQCFRLGGVCVVGYVPSHVVVVGGGGSIQMAEDAKRWWYPDGRGC